MRFLLALALLLVMPPANVQASNGCTSHASITHPPATIRVFSGRRIERVPFRLYVARVTSSEWHNVPEQLRRAGAVAVKQYAWSKALHPRRSRFGCFDLWDNRRDQIYKHHKTPPAYIHLAVEQTWHWRLLRQGRLIQTGYRTGSKTGCARDINGYHLFARSATRCALEGWSASMILRRYYGAVLVR